MKTFTKEQVLEILESMADNLQFLRDTIERGEDFGFDLDLATVYAAHKFDPMMEFLASTGGSPLAD